MKSDANLQKQLEQERRKVDVEHFDVTVRELVRMAAEGELVRAPVYQRKFRWSEEDESRLIESIYLGLPVPSIYVATNKNGKWELVDGLQRISTLMHYVAEPKSVLDEIEKKNPLVLCELKPLSRFNGMPFGRIPAPMQLAFLKRSLRVTALSDKSDRKVRFDLFERLNNGGVALTPQEVRACVYRGKFANLLRSLSEDSSFGVLLKLQEEKQNDGTKEELVLKFFAYLYERDSFDGNVKEFLNDYMEGATKSFDYDAGRQLFLETAASVSAIIGGPLLRAGVYTTPLNQLEAVMVGAAELIRAGSVPVRPAADWLNDPELVRTSTKGTNTPSMLRGRIERARDLLAGKP